MPYFFLVSMGALQAIPEELTEAGRVDGGGPLQLFRRVTFPLLLVAVAPLLIASFAFNFNNFNNIYFLTGGGPPQANSSIAGSTDILISYTYKLAIAAGKGQDFALASAVSIIIFLIVAAISGDLVLADEGAGGARMSTVEAVAAGTKPAVREAPAPRRPKLADTWWRHLVGIVACLFALFPVWFIASAAFNADQSVSGTSFLPTHFTTKNFTQILGNSVIDQSSGSKVDAPYLRWFLNSMLVAGVAAFLTVHPRGARRVRVQPLPLQGTAVRDARAAADPDVPAAAARSSRST